MKELARLKWRCRRGIRELDQLLGAYLETRYSSAPDSQRDAFRRLLELPDPAIYAWILGRDEPAEESLRELVAKIRAISENGPPSAPGERILCDLSHLGLISVQGEQTQSFLQSQFSNDVYRVSPERGQMNSFCSPKGRMLANFYVFLRDDTFYLQLPRELVEPVVKRLRLFVLRAKVRLSDASDQLVRIGFTGPEADSALQQLIGPVPAQVNQLAMADSITVIRLSGPHPRFELVAEPETLQTLWDALADDATPSTAAAWALQDIYAGIPTIYPATSDVFVPQMANMELVDGVSFTKGCYPGQEVVARTRYLGKLKRRMYRAHLAVEQPPRPGENLYSPTDSTGQSVGKVVDAQPSPEGGVELLAVIQIARQETGDVRLGSAAGPPLRFEPLPYPLNPEESPPREG